MGPLAQQLLQQARKLADGKSPWLLPSSHRRGASILGEALTRGVYRNRATFALPPFNVHDLRRSFITHLRAEPEHRPYVSYLVNHLATGITARYDRNDYGREKMRAMLAWEAKLQGFLSAEGSA